MIGILRYSAATAAVRAAMARLLSPDDWERLLDASPPSAMLNALEGTVYESAAREAGEDLKDVQRRLRGVSARRFRIPLPFLGGDARELTDWLWRPFEINNLIMMLRGMHSRMPSPRIRQALVPLGDGSSVDWGALGSASDLSALIDALGESVAERIYARALENAANEYRRRETAFVLEVSLYLAYYRRLASILDRMGPVDRRAAAPLVHNILESHNLVGAFRYRIFFRFGPETILSYSAPLKGRVTAGVIQRAATGAPLFDLVRGLWGDALPEVDHLRDRSPRDALVELEVILRRLRLILAREAAIKHTLGLAPVLAYGILLQSETEDLIALLEGAASGWPRERIRACMIGKRGRE